MPPQHKGIGGGHKGIGRHDDLVARLYLQKQSCHLKGMGTGGGQQHLRRTAAFFQPGLASGREGAVAADLLIVDRLLDIFEFVPLKGGL